MTAGWATDGNLLLVIQAAQQAVSTLPDTIVTIQVADDPGLFERVVSIVQGLMTIAVLVLILALVPAAWHVRRSYRRASDLMDRLQKDITPILHHTTTVVDNLNYVTTSLRADVQMVNRTVTAANQRVLQASHLAERRLQEFTALLDVVQEEAEDTFVSAASAVRGMRAGALQYGMDLRSAGSRLGGPGQEMDDALDDASDPEDQEHGYDAGEDSEENAHVPRIRPRGRA